MYTLKVLALLYNIYTKLFFEFLFLMFTIDLRDLLTDIWYILPISCTTLETFVHGHVRGKCTIKTFVIVEKHCTK